MGRVLPHRAIAVVISDFLHRALAVRVSPAASIRKLSLCGQTALCRAVAANVQTALRMANRKHDVVAVQITDRYELELPALGRLTLEDAETGEILELNTGHAASRDAFALRSKNRMISRGSSARRAWTPFNCAQTNLTRRPWANFSRTGKNGDCADEIQRS